MPVSTSTLSCCCSVVRRPELDRGHAVAGFRKNGCPAPSPSTGPGCGIEQLGSEGPRVLLMEGLAPDMARQIRALVQQEMKEATANRVRPVSAFSEASAPPAAQRQLANILQVDLEEADVGNASIESADQGSADRRRGKLARNSVSATVNHFRVLTDDDAGL